jgi:Rieske Fe-S protein
VYKIWQGAVHQKQMLSSQVNEIITDNNLPDGVRFYGKVILVKEHSTYQLLSAKCSHLGCRINKVENGQLVCPCHGSRYDLQGNPIVGPSVKALRKLDFRIDRKKENTSIFFKI